MKITKNDKHYPDLLKQINNSPEHLYYRGDIEILQKTCIAIVGTRKYSEYGEFVTKKIIKELAIYDIAIVSGLAKGIDTIAHTAALKNDLPTIAVLGSGIENIYPRENLNLAQEIEKHGLIVSEYDGEQEPIKHQFPLRNRIISGLSVATLVIEAPAKSGTMITAKHALEQGRDTFVVPGDIDRPNSKGTLQLLQNGAAYPISSGNEMMEVLMAQPRLKFEKRPIDKPINEPASTSPIKPDFNLTPEQLKVFSTISPYRRISAEKIKEKVLLPIQAVLSAISFLEIYGLIYAKDGKYCRKC